MKDDVCLWRNIAHLPNRIDHICKDSIPKKPRQCDHIEKELVAHRKPDEHNDPKWPDCAKEILLGDHNIKAIAAEQKFYVPDMF